MKKLLNKQNLKLFIVAIIMGAVFGFIILTFGNQIMYRINEKVFPSLVGLSIGLLYFIFTFIAYIIINKMFDKVISSAEIRVGMVLYLIVSLLFNFIFGSILIL